MPLLRNTVKKENAEPQAEPSTGEKKMTLKERMALKRQNDTIPMVHDGDVMDANKNVDEKPPFDPDSDDTQVITVEEKKKILKSTKKSDDADDGLPTDDTDQVVSMTSLTWLAIAPPGFGKTEEFSVFPESLMLACEGGHKFVRGKKLIIDSWSEGRKGEDFKDHDGNIHVSFVEALRRIEVSERFKFIIIDTLDALIKKCIDQHTAKANQAHLSDMGDYGKGFDLGQNDPIRKAINDIMSTGRGMGLITHQQINTNNFSKGPKAKKETSLPNGIYKIVFPQVDIVIHGEFGGVREGNKHRDRIWRSVGSEDLVAKNRGGILPPAFIAPLDLEERAVQIKSFFNEDPTERKAAVDVAYAEYVEFYGEVE